MQQGQQTMEPNSNARGTAQFASGFNVLAGIWLIIAPWVLGYAVLQGAVWNDVIIGIAVFVLACVRVFAAARFASISWINFVLGAWLIIAPFVISYGVGGGDVGAGAAGNAGAVSAGAAGSANAGVAMWNDIIVGIIVIALAAVSVGANRKVK